MEICTGTVKLKLYKGNISNAGVWSEYSLYDPEIATFDEDEVYNQADSAGFINLFLSLIHISFPSIGRNRGRSLCRINSAPGGSRPQKRRGCNTARAQ